MAKLAIKGHPTRGKEIIQLLEMLGGNNKYNFRGDEDEWFVLNKTIQRSDRLFDEKGFTLEEFLEKFPYKVGDKVSSKHLKNYEISMMEWSKLNNRVSYKLKGVGWCSADDLQPYKEEAMEDKGTLEQIDLTRELRIADEVEVILGDYEFVLKDGKTYFVKKNKYPKTYEECCNVIGISRHDVDIDLPQPYQEKMFNLFKLRICRDAYWKIAGEQMGLDKPWEPDFTNNDEERYGIYTLANKVERDFCGVGDVNMVLSFPAEEMRDAFYEDFKELINEVKELL